MARKREQCSRNRDPDTSEQSDGGSEMSKHVIVGAGAVGRGVAAVLAEAGHEVVIVSKSGRAPTTRGSGGGRRRHRPAGAHRDRRRRRRRSTTAPTRPTTTGGRPSGRRSPRRCSPRPSRTAPTSSSWATSTATARSRAGSGPTRRSRPPARNGRIRVAMWEAALAEQAAGRIRVTEARASDFIGPESGAQAHLGDRVIPRLLAGKPVKVFGSLDVPHSWTYVPDVSRTLAMLGTDDRSWGRAWHVPTNPALSQRPRSRRSPPRRASRCRRCRRTRGGRSRRSARSCR